MREDYDIAIVGCGPVGLLAAILLGRLGHSVGLFERQLAIYPRPRAVHYDDEIARVFQRIGIGGELAAITEPASTYEWRNAGGETLLMLDRSRPGPSGWPAATMFTQPQLELLLEQTAAEEPSVELHRGWEVEGLSDSGESIEIALRAVGVREDVNSGRAEGLIAAHSSAATQSVSARYAIGCDGAASIVRGHMDTGIEDLGFAFDWLIADTVPRDPALLAGVNLQICDPARPTTLVSGGPGRRRWEWMLLPGETRRDVETEQFVWGLLERSGIGKRDVELERHTVYTFRARWAKRWRDGRLLLAGDAAHLMPPFAGQGMCSGIRDAMTLSWHLDLVLRDLAHPDTLDSYTSERRAHLQHAIAVSVELGKVICIADEADAGARDEVLLGAREAAGGAAVPEPPAPSLGPGIRDHAAGEEPAGADAAGSLFPQGRVAIDGTVGLLEDRLSPPSGFVIYAFGAEPETLLDAAEAAAIGTLGCSFVRVDPAEDIDGVYEAWFTTHACDVALVRPDFYVFGTASGAAEANALVARLKASLKTTATPEEMLAR
ncbi:MAG TPA: bifunctional 3-(3-hydroxy-phenyl)propionate/3-hydroxycinnamic acid hydroxylase [Solirubrobacteraceae bacterium]|jgi:2-polyprenyl-6-methoxyphenol hydroxylase-like FAD-dependent oxidoreductase|nr:bifunctional 3-(3-hydroxy-phenyl)propionate/3-hydroxycinnamic acid hydroxylase [Solirubrobacteraceae bacterium]